MCAGGELGKDACTGKNFFISFKGYLFLNLKKKIFLGDGGAPLVCFVRGQWFVQGIVAWGVNCAQNVPGVYMNMTNYISWIQSVTISP